MTKRERQGKILLFLFFMRNLLEIFERRFDKLNLKTLELLEKIPNEKLFWKPREIGQTMTMFSCGEYILRSAGAVEQTFGGITTRLWDDPFEWTLPEKLSNVKAIKEYLQEVETTRKKGFTFFTSDADLSKQMPAPENLKPIFEILLDTNSRAEHFLGRAFAIFQTFSDEKLPRI